MRINREFCSNEGAWLWCHTIGYPITKILIFHQGKSSLKSHIEEWSSKPFHPLLAKTRSWQIRNIWKRPNQAIIHTDLTLLRTKREKSKNLKYWCHQYQTWKNTMSETRALSSLGKIGRLKMQECLRILPSCRPWKAEDRLSPCYMVAGYSRDQDPSYRLWPMASGPETELIWEE